ncbi:hypothetical protein, partial [Cupriavidus pinatubonensis]|uniref:hypothetical protein n=1 Tax=Cupriavidus pinatubonensis TaxID=248026 RepID=UPI001CC78F3B
ISCPRRLAMFGGMFGKSFSTYARQTHPVGPQIERDVTAALRHMLRAVLETDIRVLGDAMPPNGVPVFRLPYFKAMQAKAEEEGRMPGATRH